MSESGFIFQIISTLVQGMALFTEGICLEKLLTGRDDRGSKKIRILNWFVWGFIFVVIKCMFIAPPVYYCVLYPVLLSITHAFVLIYFYRDRIWLRFTHGAMLLLQNILSEFILYVCFGQVKNLNFLRPDFGNPYLAERSAMIAVLSIFMNSIYTVFVLKIQKKKAIAVGSIWIAVMFQLLCAFTVLGAIRWSTSEAINYNIYITYMSGAVGLEFSISLLFFSQSEKREIKENVRKLQQEAELKKAHYEQVEIHRQELEKLRSDYGTILTFILELMERGETTEAEHVLQDLSVRISATREYPFCGVPVVNAILTEKQQICKEEGLSFIVNLIVPGTTGIAELDLCMIFGNLMDNAIRAAGDVRAEGKVSEITLRGGIVQEYLIIKCRNTALENHKNQIWGTGYGHKILADIAKKYDGDFQSGYENGNFMAQISLRLRN